MKEEDDKSTKDQLKDLKRPANRRSFMKNAPAAAGTASIAGGLLSSGFSLFGQEGESGGGGSLNPGDTAMLRFAAAAETLETDFWVQ
jgi:hypothetical protein